MVGVVIIVLLGGVCGAVIRADCRCCSPGDIALGGARLGVSGADGNEGDGGVVDGVVPSGAVASSSLPAITISESDPRHPDPPAPKLLIVTT